MAKWVVTGASGLLGHHMCVLLQSKGHEVVAVHHNHPVEADGVRAHKLDLIDFGAVQGFLTETKPDYMFHAAAQTNVDACESNPGLAYAYNTELSRVIAESCRQQNIKMVYITTDQLWRGDKANVTEDEPVSPVNVYGTSKSESEKQVLAVCSEALIIRTNFFGVGRPWRKSFSDWLLDELQNGRAIKGFDDIYYTPIAIDYLLTHVYSLVQSNAAGIFHVAGRERISKYEFIMQFTAALNLPTTLIEKCSSENANLKAQRPKDMSLSVAKAESVLGCTMPTVDESISTLLKPLQTTTMKVA